ncbi:MAG TPA: hypothetical protein VFQ51_02200 [Vicinamibacteria bacterium]|nr:hypothetical protein [Vicinamibacteria bacterium]
MSENVVKPGCWSTMGQLLRDPAAALADFGRGSMNGGAAMVLVAAACAVAYGATAGLYQGGAQVALAALKAPLIVAGSIALCLPSLYVFAGLGGATLDGRRLRAILCGLVGLMGLMLAALLPISWLFSVSSRSLGFLVILHLLVWGVALWFGGAFLLRVVPEAGARSGLVLWVMLVGVVSLQVATTLRPVLLRAPGAPLVERGRLSFLEHVGRAFDAPPAPR